MKYFIQRGINEYGPYTLADLQRYVAQGNIAMTDLTRSEGMTDWVPVSQVIGNIPAPAPAAAAPPAGGAVYPGTPGAGSAYGATPAYATVVPGPVPPDFHWALVLLLGIVTCALFLWVWLIVEATWIRKIKPASKGLLFVLLSLGCSFVSILVRGVTDATYYSRPNPLASLLSLASIVFSIVGVFTMRSDLQDYYNTTENINLRLSGVMTFFFAVFYFQHHFSRIAKWKKTGVLEPQG
jgi:hypothetical protein